MHCIPFTPRYGDIRRLITLCGVPGIDPHLMLQLLLHPSHAGHWFGVVVEPHSIFRRWTIFDQIVNDDWLSVVLRSFFIGCVTSIFTPAALLDLLDELDGGDG